MNIFVPLLFINYCAVRSLFVKLVKLFYFQSHNVFNKNKEAQKIQGKFGEPGLEISGR